MIGQEKLLTKISKYTKINSPDSIIIEGESGCGKHLLLNTLSTNFDMPIQDITKRISADTLLELYTLSTSVLYLIDMKQAAKSKRIDLLQNAILKFVEEPPTQCKVIIICENKSQLLDTIQNRCQILSFEEYTHDELIEFCHENCIKNVTNDMLDIFDTPGKLLQANPDIIKNMTDLTQLMISSIRKASVSNTLTIVNRIDFDDNDSSKFPLDIFIKYFELQLVKYLSSNISIEEYNLIKKYYTDTIEFRSKCNLLNVNKKLLFENYLLSLRGVI